jgi:ribonuclease Y
VAVVLTVLLIGLFAAVCCVAVLLVRVLRSTSRVDRRTTHPASGEGIDIRGRGELAATHGGATGAAVAASKDVDRVAVNGMVAGPATRTRPAPVTSAGGQAEPDTEAGVAAARGGPSQVPAVGPTHRADRSRPADTAGPARPAEAEGVDRAQGVAEAPGADRAQGAGPADADTRADADARAEADTRARQRATEMISSAEREAAAIRERAEAEAALRASLLEARAREAGRKAAEAFRAEAERDIRERRAELLAHDTRLGQREQRLEDRASALEEARRRAESRERELDEREAELEARRAQLDEADKERREELERVGRLTTEAARTELLSVVEREARKDAAVIVRDIENEATERGEERARRIVTLAIQRVAAETTTESVLSVLHLPSEEMKGRIIGREGRNIRAFESVTGVNVIIDDTPEAVLLSCFDPVRREVGRLTLSALVSDGRIHPHRIEEEFERAGREVERSCERAGEDALLRTGISEMHPELVMLLGRLRYRTSYGQNVLAHLVECAHLAGIMAAELRLPPILAKRGTLLHDLGKALTHEIEGSHALIGAEVARRYGEDPEVIHAIEAHHNEVEPRSIAAVLTQAADSISGGRPGARRESLESYVKRLERIEQIAGEHSGVEKVFAMQAGREVRVMVIPEEVDETAARALARDVARQIEDELTYPGQIRVTVVRETRAVETAH